MKGFVESPENCPVWHDDGRYRWRCTGDFTRDVDFKLPTSILHHRIKAAVPDGHAQLVNATQHATSLLGDSIGANLFILGVAYQSGLIPLSSEAIEKAIEMNGVAVPFSKQAFHWGRVWSNDRSAIEALSPEATLPEPQPINATLIGIESPQNIITATSSDVAIHPSNSSADTPDQLTVFIEKRMEVLTQYQNAKYGSAIALLFKLQYRSLQIYQIP